ncbi:MAG: putative toxin-antitoxin system toxin component, PIN family [Nanoarchaeota archaeon]|nr:putative toxin-antitoxin system toxin component, PIN family [Nanoarchaeota archaeon]MBU1004294.1 putative toxin-antitoxin system toxin component, PIN family [Nanoarchaeota archaeon]MBU1945488.1 putative toxin-antitoxin system toxin component, PIN family [Nanoarchaeota archaeon]
MIRVTTDTNTLVSATIIRGNEFNLLQSIKNRKIILILSLEILDEFKDVISRAKFNYPTDFVNDEVKKILGISQIVCPKTRIDIIKEDPDDNMVLECAEEGKVDYIVSGDDHLLNLKEYNNIKIIRTADFLRMIQNG